MTPMKIHAAVVWAVLLPCIAAWLPGGLQAQGISMRPVTYMIMNGAPVLVLNDASLLSNGLLAPDNSTVIFTGVHSGRTIIGGTGTLVFNNLTVNKSASDVFLSGTVTVTGTLAMVRHNLQLNNHTLNLGGTGSISGEGSQSYITDASAGTGTITATRVLSAPHAVNPGNIGVEISSSQNLGTVTITRGRGATNAADGRAKHRSLFCHQSRCQQQPERQHPFSLPGCGTGRVG